MKLKIICCGVLSSLIIVTPGVSTAGEICITDMNGVQMTSDANGNLTLNVYSKQVQAATSSGSTYLYYSGHNETAKVYQSMFLTAKAASQKICVSYSPGSPAHRLVLTSVGVADADGWPWQ